jgi:DNA recombination protein RmuC
MLYPGLVSLMWFVLGLAAGSLIVGLWMRARLARLEASKQFADNATAKLNETFQALADTALRSNQASFLEASRAQMTGDMAQKQTAIEGVVRPLTDSLERLQTQVRELERAREKAYGSLGEQLQSLSRETTILSTALRSPQARGRWGEVTLRRVAELAGMVKNCDFLEQAT